MTTCRSPHCLPLKLPALAATALLACTSCFTTPVSAQPHHRNTVPDRDRQPTNTPPSRVRPQQARYPDPRYRPAMGISELQAVAGKVAKSTGRVIHWRIALGSNPGPLARISGGLDDCTIYLHPVGAKTVPPNTWAFIFGHEFAHRVENLGNHSQSNPTNELKADIAGARYAMAAGYRIEAFLGWVLTEPNRYSASHGYPHDRVYAIADHFGVPRNAVQSQAQRYSKDRPPLNRSSPGSSSPKAR